MRHHKTIVTIGTVKAVISAAHLTKAFSNVTKPKYNFLQLTLTLCICLTIISHALIKNKKYATVQKDSEKDT